VNEPALRTLPRYNDWPAVCAGQCPLADIEPKAGFLRIGTMTFIAMSFEQRPNVVHVTHALPRCGRELFDRKRFRLGERYGLQDQTNSQSGDENSRSAREAMFGSRVGHHSMVQRLRTLDEPIITQTSVSQKLCARE
jgi:hypothetical protein